jgi:hypothetical protein
MDFENDMQPEYDGSVSAEHDFSSDELATERRATRKRRRNPGAWKKI